MPLSFTTLYHIVLFYQYISQPTMNKLLARCIRLYLMIGSVTDGTIEIADAHYMWFMLTCAYAIMVCK